MEKQYRGTNQAFFNETTSAEFFAIQCLQQHGIEGKKKSCED